MEQSDPTMQEDLNDARKEAREVIEAFEQLGGCNGWKVYKKFLEKQVRAREISALYSSDKEVADMGASRERLAGEAIGLALALKFTEMLLPDAKETIIKLDELENQDEI